MAAKRAKASARRPSTVISRGNLPIERQPPSPPPPLSEEALAERAARTALSEEKLISRGTLMAVLYAEVGDYTKVAEMFGVALSTVRWWVHETRKRKREDLQKIADRLRGDLAQIAVDRIQEGLIEGETEFAATLGVKVLHGMGELKSHSAVKNDLPTGSMALTLVVERRDPTAPAVDVVEGAVLGVERALDAPLQTAAEAE